MPFDATLYTRILDRVLLKGKEQARAFCKSKTLSRFMYHAITREGKSSSSGRVSVPHYWAKFFHDGRSAIIGKLMVYFKDPSKDPRIASGYPIYRSQVKHLSKAEFDKYRKSDDLIITKAVGPSVRRVPNKFFSNTGGMSGLDAEAGKIAQQEAYKYVEEQLKAKGLKKRTISRTI